MSNVSNINEYKPHTSGPARCMECGHTWIAVIPIGTIVTECPECHFMKGRRDGFILPDGDDDTYRCLRCADADGSNDLFIFTRSGAFCCGCGHLHEWNTVVPHDR